jgi:tRNA threonylcarbamoyladenosine biosynthesis protein TsaB
MTNAIYNLQFTISPVRILALETATRAGSWALAEDGAVVAEGQGGADGTHDLRLPQPLMAMLAARGLAAGDVDFLAVATGPGSFTGLRVGIATMQGLAMATGRRVIPIPTLDAIAAGAAAEPAAAGIEYIAAWLDAQRKEIYGALYAVRDEPRLLMPPQVGTPAVIAAEMAGLIGSAHAAFAGDGAHRYHASFETLGLGDARLLPMRPIAPDLARLAARRVADAVAPHALVPVYVRRTDAELARERR